MILSVLAFLISVLGLRAHVIRTCHRAEQLQNQVLALKPGRSTLREVQDIVRVTEKPKDYGGYAGQCTESECHAQLDLETFGIYKEPYVRPFKVFGIRRVVYHADIDVLNGVVDKASFEISYYGNKQHELEGKTVVLKEFLPGDLLYSPNLKSHPSFALCKGQIRDDSNKVWGEYFRLGTTTVTPESFLQVSCVYSFRGCSSSLEFLGEAHKSSSDLTGSALQNTCRDPDKAATEPWWVTGAVRNVVE